jgi:hypothetical protein
MTKDEEISKLLKDLADANANEEFHGDSPLSQKIRKKLRKFGHMGGLNLGKQNL